MRWFALVALVVPLAACASVSPERAAEQDRMWDAARECKSKFGTIQAIERIDHEGRLHFTYLGSGPDNAAFLACYQKGVEQRLGSSSGLNPGRVSDATQKLTRVLVPIAESRNAAFVTATLNKDHHALLLLDTGASMTILSPAVAAQLGITPPPGARVRSLRAAGGTTLSVPIARLESIALGAFVVESLDVGVYDVLPQAANVNGILGTDFLHHFRTALDLRARTLTLETRRASVTVVNPSAPVAAPAWNIGDQWTHRVENPDGVRSWTYVVRATETVDGVECWVVGLDRRDLYHRRDNLGILLEKLDGVVERQYRPSLQFFQWPLGVGRSWQDTYVAEIQGASQPSRSVTLTVESEEEIQVPAGTFRALKIVRRISPSDTLWTEVWYAPQVKFWVRRLDHLSAGIRVSELTAYKIRGTMPER
jgi:predicted aspartyl protease